MRESSCMACVMVKENISSVRRCMKANGNGTCDMAKELSENLMAPCAKENGKKAVSMVLAQSSLQMRLWSMRASLKMASDMAWAGSSLTMATGTMVDGAKADSMIAVSTTSKRATSSMVCGTRGSMMVLVCSITQMDPSAGASTRTGCCSLCRISRAPGNDLERPSHAKACGSTQVPRISQ